MWRQLPASACLSYLVGPAVTGLLRIGCIYSARNPPWMSCFSLEGNGMPSCDAPPLPPSIVHVLLPHCLRRHGEWPGFILCVM